MDPLEKCILATLREYGKLKSKDLWREVALSWKIGFHDLVTVCANMEKRKLLIRGRAGGNGYNWSLPTPKPT